jgi:hypothetical protein
MSTLLQLQRALQRSVMENDVSDLDWIAPTTRVPTTTRIGIYVEAYRLRLRQALASNYPRLQELLGEQSFATIADGYIDAHPSSNASIRWFGDRLEPMLEHALPEQPWLAELARWEWAIGTAFDAPDDAHLSLQDFSEVAIEDWPRVCFRFASSMRRLQLRTNAPALFKALNEGLKPPEPARCDENTAWLIWRQDLRTRYRSMQAGEDAALCSILAGQSFEQMCTVLCDCHSGDEVPLHAAMLLREWISTGLVQSITLQVDCE